MKTVKLDSYKEFTPQNLIDEAQKQIDNGEVKDIIIITMDDEGDARMMTSPLTDTDSIGLLEMAKMSIFYN